MQILLLSPPTISAVKAVVGTTGPPLGLAYLVSMVRDAHDVRIVDSLAEDYNYGDVERIIKKYDPDVVGITSTTSMIPDAYAIAKIAKRYNENVKIVMGGPHVTFLPERTFQECPYIDFIVRGEGELTFRELIDSLERDRDPSNILGLSINLRDKVRNNPPRPLIKDIDTIPMPSYDLLPMEKYQANGVRFGTVMTSRGWPFNCAFCSSSLQFGKRWRGHSDSRVIEELKHLHEKYRICEIEFLDDTFTLNKHRAIRIARRIVKEGLDISWLASSRVDTFTEEVAEAMKKSGCHTIYFGIESGSRKTLNFIGKGITPEQLISAVKKAKKHKLRALGSFVIGFPEETKEDIKKTIKFSKKVGVDFAQFTIATPYPGTRLWKYASAKKLILTFDWRKYTTLDPVMKLKNFTSQQITKLLQKAYISFYLRPSFLIKDLISRKGFILRRAIPRAIKMAKSVME
ncbi:MAG TPA: B12-binding domain-containing radical SAM protein [Thermococcus litoralis]|uniref:B12-binding domain-containing radical SAM protein n=1 Tax=Thermococcus litoralis TaxID=2265 RepID=A0A7C5NZA4_THELI|nr:B12-binding domain-containing radical SAM protein [Thermococcus litoralis]